MLASRSNGMLARPVAAALRSSGLRAMGTYRGKGKISDPKLLGDVDSVDQTPGAGVPVGTPRQAWKAYGYETRCASVVKVSDFASRRAQALSLPIVMGSTYELDSTAHGARLHDKKEAALMQDSLVHGVGDG